MHHTSRPVHTSRLHMTCVGCKRMPDILGTPKKGCRLCCTAPVSSTSQVCSGSADCQCQPCPPGPAAPARRASPIHYTCSACPQQRLQCPAPSLVGLIWPRPLPRWQPRPCLQCKRPRHAAMRRAQIQSAHAGATALTHCTRTGGSVQHCQAPSQPTSVLEGRSNRPRAGHECEPGRPWSWTHWARRGYPARVRRTRYARASSSGNTYREAQSCLAEVLLNRCLARQCSTQAHACYGRSYPARNTAWPMTCGAGLAWSAIHVQALTACQAACAPRAP